jgi:predicted secreted protein
MKNFILTITLGLSSALSQAADSAALVFLGLSPDGKYAAFEQYGVQDGSGFAFSSIQILDIDANRFATNSIDSLDENPNYEAEEQGTKVVRTANYKKAQAQFKNFGIIEKSKIKEGKLRQVVARSPYESHDSLRQLQFHNRGIFSEVTYAKSVHDLSLSTHSLPCHSNNPFCQESDGGKGLKLELKTFDSETQSTNTLVLQNDTRIPASRAFTLDYSIAGAYIVDPAATSLDRPFDLKTAKVIAIIAVTSQGFEGPDLGYMFVSGKLEK